MEETQADLRKELVAKKKLDDDLTAKLKKVLDEFKQRYNPTA
jgi:hypothetical protein